MTLAQFDNYPSFIISRQRKNRVAGNPEIASRSVYVTGLTWDTEEQELFEYFGQAGTVVSAAILRQRRNGRYSKSSMGCGVVEFATREMAMDAVTTLNETELKGRMIRCREDRIPDEEDIEESPEASASASVGGSLQGGHPVGPRNSTRGRTRGATGKIGSESSPTVEPCKVFVTSLTWDTTEDDLIQHFSSVGPVVSAEILSTRKGRSIGSGIVEFADTASVAQAIQKLSNADLKGRIIAVREYITPN